MPTATHQNQCATCQKGNAVTKCVGCSQEFCFNHFVEHRQELSKQRDQIEQDRDLFQQTLNQQTTNPQHHLLIEQVDRWEQESIEKINQTAQEVRQLLFIHTNENIVKIKLEELTQQLKDSREQDNIIENSLQIWKDELRKLTEELNKPSNIVVQQSETALVNKIQIQFSSLVSIPIISSKAKWMQNGITVAGGNGPGNDANQLNGPVGTYVDDDQNIYVADYHNNRIVKLKKNATIGQVVAGGQGVGNQNNQLSHPREVILDQKNNFLIISDEGNQRVVRWSLEKDAVGETIISGIACRGLAIDNDGHLYVSDFGENEVRRWKIGEKNGTLVAGGNGSGNRFDQLNQPYKIFVDQDQSVYVSDCSNHRVMKWMKGATEGVVVARGHGEGNALKQLNCPGGIVVDQLGTLYVADHYNHRVVRWLKGATEGSVVVGGNGQGAQVNQLNGSWNLSFDRQNNIYVTDHSNHRIQKFNIESDSDT